MSKKNKFDIEEEIDKMIKKAVKNTAIELSSEIEIAWERVIDEFYEDYTPVWYKRTFSTYKASDGYSELGSGNLVPYIKNINRDKSGNILVGITVSSDYIPGDPYEADKDWVFERTFEKGYHGYNQHEAQGWTSNHSGKDNDNRKWTTTAKVMKPTPEARMNVRFNKIANQKHITDVFSKEIAKLF